MCGLRLNCLLVFLLYKDKISPQRLISAVWFLYLFPLPQNHEACHPIHPAAFSFSHLCRVWLESEDTFLLFLHEAKQKLREAEALSPRTTESVHHQSTSNSNSVVFS